MYRIRDEYKRFGETGRDKLCKIIKSKKNIKAMEIRREHID